MTGVRHMAERAIWGIHMAHEHGLRPVEQGYVAIGWYEIGNLAVLAPTR